MEKILKEANLEYDKIVVIDKDIAGRKKPFGIKVEGREKINENTMIVAARDYINKNNLKESKIMLCYNISLKNTDYYVFDVDNNSTYDEVLKVYPFLENTLYCNGNRKGFHFYLKIDNLPFYKNEIKVGNENMVDIDLIGTTKNIWENIEKEIFNNSIKSLDWNDIKNNFNIDEMNFGNVNKENKTKKEKKEKKEIINKEENDKYFKGLIDCLSNKRAEHGDTWLHIGASIYYEKGEDGLNYFINFSKKSTKHNPTDEELEYHYNEYCSKFNDFTIGTIKYFAKKDNPTLYYQLIHCNINCETWTAIDWANYLSKELKFKIKYCLKKWFICPDKYWKEAENPVYLCVGEMKKLLSVNFSRLVDLDDEKRKNLNKALMIMTKEIDKAGFNSQLKEHLKILCKDDEFIEKLYSHKEKLIFNNGILDMRTGIIKSEILPENYIPENYIINWDYDEERNEENINFIKNKLLEIHNNNKEQLDWILRVYGYALSGSMEEQIMVNIKGVSAGNGKTTITETLKKIIPTLVSLLPSEILNLNYTKRHKFLGDIWGKRILGFEELPSDKKLDTQFLKKITDGEIQNEIMFGTSCSINITGTCFCNTNHTPNFDCDEGLKRRYKEVNTNNKFHKKDFYDKLKEQGRLTSKDYLAINNLKEQLIEKKNDLIHILIEGFKDYLKEGKLKEPEFITKWSNQTFDANNIQKNLFDDYFEITNNYLDKVSKKEFCNLCKLDSRGFLDFVKKENLNYESQKKYQGTKGYLIGVKRNEILDEEDE